MPCKAFFVTGRNSIELKEIVLRGMDADYFYITIDGRDACHTREANSHFTHEGRDFHNGQFASPEYLRLFNLPSGTIYHTGTRFYERPDGSKLTGLQADATFHFPANLAEKSTSDPFAI